VSGLVDRCDAPTHASAGTEVVPCKDWAQLGYACSGSTSIDDVEFDEFENPNDFPALLEGEERIVIHLPSHAQVRCMHPPNPRRPGQYQLAPTTTFLPIVAVRSLAVGSKRSTVFTCSRGDTAPSPPPSPLPPPPPPPPPIWYCLHDEPTCSAVRVSLCPAHLVAGSTLQHPSDITTTLDNENALAFPGSCKADATSLCARCRLARQSPSRTHAVHLGIHHSRPNRCPLLRHDRCLLGG